MKKVLVVLAVLIAIIAVLGAIAPNDFQIEREVTINKPKDVVFGYLKSLKSGNEWNPWSKKDPNIVMDYKGEDGAVGAVASWVGNGEVGAGEQEIINIEEGERIDTELRFTKPMEVTNNAYLVTETIDENQTRVKWGMMGDNPFPFNVICMVFSMKDRLAKDLDDGLSGLKSILEKQ